MEDFNTVNDVEVVNEAPQETDTTTSEVTEEVTETPETVEPVAKVQSAEENSRYAEARRQAEAEAKAIKAQNDRLMQALKPFGYEGSPDEIADAIMAQTQGISVEEAQARRETQERAEAERTQMQSETEFYRNIAIQKLMADDLRTLQTVYPEVKNLEGLGNEFFSLLGATKDPLLAYEAVQAKKAKTSKPVPQEIGAVNSSSSKEKDFYTSSEVDKLSKSELANPKIMQRVMDSMTRWK